MNKTLLLILCDFLLLSLLALTRWEDARPPATGAAAKPVAAEKAEAGGAATAEQDLVAVMRLSLEDEAARRRELTQALETTEAARVEEAAAKARLAEELARTERTAEELDRTLATTRAGAEAERARNAQLARELAAREAEAGRREAELARVAAAEGAARARAEELAVSVGVAQREKQILQEQAETLRAAVEAERVERQRVQETTTALAEQTGALTREIREARPVNANVLYQEFLTRRVAARFSAERASFLGPVSRAVESRTVLASDGRDVVALLHVDDSPFDLRAPSQPDWGRLELGLARGGARVDVARVAFASSDPRVLLAPVTAEEAGRLGGGAYLLALEPFKFPEAVLISAGGAGYGEVPFKVDPRNPGHVKMDNRLFRRITGDFSPSRGDLVLSKTGELLGVMVTADTCLLVNNFLPQRTLVLGTDLKATPTGPELEAVAKRYLLLPAGVK